MKRITPRLGLVLLALPFLAQSPLPEKTSPAGSEIGKESPPPGTPGGPMVLVPAGKFWMGCNDCWDFEKPYHQVYLHDFYLDQYEVTQGEYSRCVEAGECGDNQKYEGFTGERQPVVGVTWTDAKDYCAWAGKRLPTEAEWEKAARGTEGWRYPWGNGEISCHLANYADCGPGRTVGVGGYPAGASPYGAMDMMGNAWEWVADRYQARAYSRSRRRDPKGPKWGKFRVLRGGGWNFTAGGVYASWRSSASPGWRGDILGFRCAAD